MNKYTKILAAAAVAAAMTTSAFAATTTSGLKDINNYWGRTAIQYFYDNHYVSGSNGMFKPNEAITREGAAAIINNMLGEDSHVATTDFKDLKGRWSERAIATLVSKNIMKGYSDGTFKPQNKITREEFAVIAYNYMKYKGITVDEKATPFSDEAKISTWARPAVNALSAKGYMKGGNYNAFSPKSDITRGEAVNVLYRIMTNDLNADQAVVTKTSDQSTMEAKVFKDIKDVYGSIKSFAGDGIMYWQGNKLHVGVKSDAKKDTLERAIAMDQDIPADTVNVQTATYSYNDYKTLMAKAERIYKATEPTGVTCKTDVDYLNEKVVLTVPSISKETQTNLNKELGRVLRIVVQ